MDRRDLLGGINDFLTDTIVLPPGDFDKELLLPVIETAKMKNNNAKRRSTRRRKQTKGRSADGQQQQSPNQGKYSIYCKTPINKLNILLICFSIASAIR